MTAIVVCKDIYKTYGTGTNRVEALRGIDLEVERGELQMLMGPSGSGKTTLISIIAGILTQTTGSCLIEGIELNHLSEKEKTDFRGKNIGFVFQSFNLIPMITNEENIAIPLLIHGIERKEALERAKKLLIDFGMEDKIGKIPKELSGGQQQRIAIARSLIHAPKIVICDEPTSSLDHITGGKVMEVLKQMVQERNLTLIVVTHDPRIIPYADRIHQMEDGKILTNERSHARTTSKKGI